jgi:hypothetical protein
MERWRSPRWMRSRNAGGLSFAAIATAIFAAQCGGGGGPQESPSPDASSDGAHRMGSGRDAGRPRADAGRDAAHPGTDATADAPRWVNEDVCSAGSGGFAWSASIAASSSTLALSDVAAGPTDDVVVTDEVEGAYEQHRWDSSGNVVRVHRDPLGAYTGKLWASSIIVDAENNLFYGTLKTGLSMGTTSGAELSFTLLPPTGDPIVSPPITNTMPTSAGPPKVLLFSTGFDSGGGYHGPLSMAAPEYFPAGVYCYASTLSGEATSAQSVTATLTTGDFEWPSLSSSLYLIQSVSASTDLGCGSLTVPKSGGVVLASLDSGGSCQWSKLLALPSASVFGKNFRVGADGTLALAVVYSGSIDFGGGPLSAAGPRALAVARFDGSGNLLSAKSYGSASSHFTIGSLGVNLAGTLILTGGYSGTVDLGGGALPASDDTFLAVFDATGAFKWNRTVTVGGTGRLIAAAGKCGVAVATDSPTVDFGHGPLSSAKPGKPATIGVAALGL